MPGHAHAAARVLVVLATLGSGCQPSTTPSAVPRLPAGTAGQVLARALDAAGGWNRWAALRDVGYINTLTLFDPVGNISSQSIGWYMAPLHRGMQARMESIGIPNDVQLGVNGTDTWIVRDGTPLAEPQRLELTRFNMVSNLFWFSLPFALAEMPATITDLGEIDGDDHVRWERLTAIFEPNNPGVPGEWFVLYFDKRTGLIDRVHAKITASFLRHELWVGKWRDYRDWNGLKKERQRQFFPANDEGEIIGNAVAEQLVEHVQLNNGYAPESFSKPPQPSGGARAQTGPLRHAAIENPSGRLCAKAPPPTSRSAGFAVLSRRYFPRLQLQWLPQPRPLVPPNPPASSGDAEDRAGGSGCASPYSCSPLDSHCRLSSRHSLRRGSRAPSALGSKSGI